MSVDFLLVAAYSAADTTKLMNTTKIVFWEDNGVWLGHLQEYSDYSAQGETLDELKDIYQDISGGAVRVRT